MWGWGKAIEFEEGNANKKLSTKSRTWNELCLFVILYFVCGFSFLPTKNIECVLRASKNQD